MFRREQLAAQPKRRIRSGLSYAKSLAKPCYGLADVACTVLFLMKYRRTC